jgi:L-arabinose isomerase
VRVTVAAASHNRPGCGGIAAGTKELQVQRVAIGGQALTIEDVVAVARGGAVAELTGPARERIVRAHEVIPRVIA